MSSVNHLSGGQAMEAIAETVYMPGATFFVAGHAIAYPLEEENISHTLRSLARIRIALRVPLRPGSPLHGIGGAVQGYRGYAQRGSHMRERRI